jgi:hypothetical protein
MRDRLEHLAFPAQPAPAETLMRAFLDRLRFGRAPELSAKLVWRPGFCRRESSSHRAVFSPLPTAVSILILLPVARSRKPFTLVCLATLCAALGACGTTTHAPAQKSTAKPEPGAAIPPAAQAVPTAAAPPASQGEQSQQGATVPNLIGVRLDRAEKELRRQGISYRVLGAAVDPGSALSASLTICRTNPLPHTHLESGTTIRLIVARSCRHAAA